MENVEGLGEDLSAADFRYRTALETHPMGYGDIIDAT